jgi:hypothetical protein
VALAYISTLVSATSLASTVYDEGEFGDFHGGHVLDFDVGTNEVTGIQGPGFTDHVDGFRFEIPAGHVGHIDFVGSFAGLAPGQEFAWIWGLFALPELAPCTSVSWPYECVVGFEAGTLTRQIFQTSPDFFIPSQWPFVDFDAIGLAPGAYLLADNNGLANGGSIGLADGGSVVFSYDVTVTVAPVPIPPAVLLLASALAALACLRPAYGSKGQLLTLR